MAYTQQYLEDCMLQAYSYESRAGWDADKVPVEYIGAVRKDNRIYEIYEDADKRHWYKTKIVTEKGIVTEYEAIFGRKEKERGWRK